MSEREGLPAGEKAPTGREAAPPDDGAPDEPAVDAGAVDAEAAIAARPDETLPAPVPAAADEAPPGDDGEPPFRIAYELTVDAAMDATRLVTGGMRRRMTYVAIGAVIAGAVISLLGEWVFGPMVAIFGVMTYAMWTMRAPERWLLGRRFRGMLGGRSVIEIGQGGLDLATPHGSGQVPWWAIHEVRTDERTVVFMRKEGIVAFAPAEAFGRPERREQIVAFARERVRAASPETQSR